MTTDESQSKMATVAVHLDQARALLIQVCDEGREWPEDTDARQTPPPIDFCIHADAKTLLTSFVEPALALAQMTCSLTQEKLDREWNVERDDESPVPFFVAEVEAVMTAAHALRGKKKLSKAERAILSQALQLQAALLGEGGLETYNGQALNPALAPPDEDMKVFARKALTSLPKAALSFLAILKIASDHGLETGFDQQTMTSITEATEEFFRQMAACESSITHNLESPPECLERAGEKAGKS